MQPQSSSSTRTHDIPKPETGLAEWTSKIKAMQRQVDADEEAEQKMLEEEIAASRLARLRRSHGLGQGGFTDGLNMSKVQSLSDGDGGMAGDSVGVTVDRQSNQADALRRLTATNPLAQTGEFISRYTNTNSSPPSIQRDAVTKPESISLAAFIGGRSSGPKLTRHTQQQESYDGTQFQKTKHDSSPHPVFGKGGIAMPGMTTHRDAMAPTLYGNTSESNKKHWPPPSSVLSGDKVRPANQESVGTPTEKSVTRDISSRGPNIRERTTSTPAFSSSSSWNQQARTASGSSNYHPMQSSPVATNTSLRRDTLVHNNTTTPPTKSINRSVTSREGAEKSSVTPQKSPITTPSLARPIQPQPRPSPISPTPLSHIPSPAFMRPPPQKDPTPSISRLQGRGFVQNMVKVSTQLESPPTSSGRGPEKGGIPGGRKTSVLDRWQPNVSTSPSSPPASPTPKPMRKSFSNGPTQELPPQVLRTASPNKPLKAAVSHPSLRHAQSETPSSSPIQEHGARNGLGSATTLIVFKPTRVSDVPSQSTNTDEFGFRQPTEAKGEPQHVAARPTSTGYPLSHLTKDRARKPRKSKRPNTQSQQQNIPSIQNPQASESEKYTSLATAPSPTSNDFTNSSISSQSPTLVGMAIDTLKTDVPSSSPTHRLENRADTRDGGQPIVDAESNTLQPDQHVTETDKTSSVQDVTKSEEKPSHNLPMLSKHPRIPSTGNRATVMDVAQALSDHPLQYQEPKRADIQIPLSDPQKAAEFRTRNLVPPTTVEKRKSSFEKHSGTILPPLKEEESPTASPSGTLRSTHHETRRDLEHSRMKESAEAGRALSSVEPSPRAAIERLLQSYLPLAPSNPGFQTISVDVLAITGTTAITLTQNQAIFYDTEVLAIIHRSKSPVSGLVSTTLWGWQGKRSIYGERERRKLQELAKRYSTTIVNVFQHSEPPMLAHVLGTQLAVRQGTRTQWTPENTAMHLVRSRGGAIFIDEHDLSIKNLCSAFSYCISVLDTVYVWYGRGSSPPERQAALQYAQSLGLGSTHAIELSEGGNDDDEMFWMILGTEEYANADYWQWRATSPIVDPHIWRVNTNSKEDMVSLVDFFSNETSFRSLIYIIDCIWELYVLVGSDAQAHGQDLRFALNVAVELSARVAPARPFPPTVHVIVAPTQLPRDLRLNIREFDELLLNDGHIPDHMNVFTTTDAFDQLRETDALRNPKFIHRI